MEEFASICLGSKGKKHREHLWQKLLQLWCPALNSSPPARSDTDHKIHLCVVNAGSLFRMSVRKMLPLLLSQMLLAGVEMLYHSE